MIVGTMSIYPAYLEQNRPTSSILTRQCSTRSRLGAMVNRAKNCARCLVSPFPRGMPLRGRGRI